MEAAEPYVVVYRSKWKALRSVLIAGVFLAISIAMHFAPPSPNETFTDHAARILGGWFGPPAFLFLLIYSVKQFLSKTPVLMANEAGISTYGTEPILWSEIESIRKVSVSSRTCLGIVPRNVEELLNRLSPKSAKAVAWNLSMYGVARYISHLSVPMTIDALIEQLKGYRMRLNAPIDADDRCDADADADVDDLVDPEDALYNADLQKAITAVTKDNSHENRQELYRILMRITYCMPLSSPAEAGSTQSLTVTKNENGDIVLPAFSDPNALHRWVHTPSMLVMTADKLFETAIENDFAEILINPAGPAGGKLTREEYTALSRGIIPY